MDVIVIEKKVWDDMMNKIYHLCRTIPPLTHCKEGQKWISTDQAGLMFGLSRRKLESLRDEGLIETAKMGRKIYYNIESLKSLIKRVETQQQETIKKAKE